MHTHAQSEAVYFTHTQTHIHSGRVWKFWCELMLLLFLLTLPKCLFGFLCYLFYGTFCYTLFFVLLIRLLTGNGKDVWVDIVTGKKGREGGRQASSLALPHRYNNILLMSFPLMAYFQNGRCKGNR